MSLKPLKRSIEDTSRKANDQQNESFTVLKLQDPPKPKFKQQSCSGSDAQSAAIVPVSGSCPGSQSLLQTGICTKKTSESKYDRFHSQDLAVSHHSTLSSPSSLSISSSSSCSPKKFKSDQVLSSPAENNHGSLKSPRPLFVDSQTKTDYNSRVSPRSIRSLSQMSLNNIAITKRVPSNHLTCFREQQSEVDDSTVKNLCSSNNVLLSSDQSMRPHKPYIKTEESALKNILWSREPDIFVFPDLRSDTVITPVENKTLSWANANHTDETDGIDCPMDTDDCSYSMNYKSNNTYQSFELHRSTSSPGLFSKFPFCQDSMNKLETGSFYANVLDSSMIDESQTHYNMQGKAAVHHSLFSHEQLNGSSARGKRDNMSTFSSSVFSPLLDPVKTNKNSGYHKSLSTRGNRPDTCHVTNNSVYLNQRAKAIVAERPSGLISALGCGLDMNEVLDTSEADDFYNDLEKDMSSEEFSKLSMRKLDPNNNRIQTKASDKDSGGSFPIKTTADTNVCFVSVDDFSDSSGGSMDMDDEDSEKKSERRIFSECLSNLQRKPHDFWDETDGRSKISKKKQDTGNSLISGVSKSPWSRETGSDNNLDVQHAFHAPDCSQTQGFDVHTGNFTLVHSGKARAGMAPQSGQTLRKRQEKNQHIMVSVGQSISGSYKVISQLNGSVPRLCPQHWDKEKYPQKFVDRYVTMKQLSPSKPGHLKLTQLSPQQSSLLCICTDRARLSARQNMISIHKDVRNMNNVKSIMAENLKDFSDEVDGLGDKEKNDSQLPVNVSSKRNDKNQEEVVHCFNDKDPMKNTSLERESNPFVKGYQVGRFQDSLLTEHQVSHSKKDIASCSKHLAELVDKKFDDQKKERNNLYENNEHMRQLERQTQKGEHEQKQTLLYSEPTTSHQLHNILSGDVKELPCIHTLDDRIRRRKSDTSILDTSCTNLSRSRSSPSKLDETKENSFEKKHVTFHRPWLDQISPRKMSQCDANSSQCCVNSSQCDVNSSQCEKFIVSTNIVHTAQSDQSKNKSGKQKHVRHHLYPKWKMDSKRRADAFVENISDQKNTHSSGSASDCGRFQHQERSPESRANRKLEFYTHDAWNQPPSRKEARLETQPPFVCSSLLPQQEPGSSTSTHDSVNTSLSHEANRGRREDRPQNLDLQKEVDTAVSGSRQDKGCSLRNEDEIDIHIQVSEVLEENTRLRHRLERINQSNNASCSCTKIEQDILNVALDLFRTLGNEASCRENWIHEIRRTNQAVRSALDLAENCRRLCRHGRRVTDVFTGSIVIRMKCRTLIAVTDLCDLHASGELHLILINVLCQKAALSKLGMTLRVILNRQNVVTCQEYLLKKLNQAQKTREPIQTRSRKKLIPSKNVARSAENLLYSPSSSISDLCNSPMSPQSSAMNLNFWRERKFSCGEINRTAFQELNISDIDSPVSPGNFHSVREELFHPYLMSHCLSSPNILTSPKIVTSPGSSPLMSPRKVKVCEVISEQENIDQQDIRL